MFLRKLQQKATEINNNCDFKSHLSFEIWCQRFVLSCQKTSKSAMPLIKNYINVFEEDAVS